MIDHISGNIAKRILRRGEFEQNQFPKLKFGMILFVTTILIIFLTIIVGILTSSIMESMASLFALAWLRYFSGGFHFKTSEQCVFFTVVLASSIPHFPALSNTELIVFSVISLVILAVFAPSGILKQKLPIRKSYMYKWISIAIVSSNLMLISSIFGYCYLLQSISTIKLKKGGDFQ
jgi:accessory gene regulator B